MPPCLFGGHFFAFSNHKMYKAHLVFPQPRNQPLLQGVLGPITGVWCIETKVWELGVLIVLGALLLLGLFRGQSWDDMGVY